LQRLLADRGLVMSAGKMSGLWSGRPASIKLDDLNVVCAVLGCGVEELLIPESEKVQRPEHTHVGNETVVGPAAVRPKRREGRSLPPV
jgi:DNA-binding Xre family transcriptional regulator